jgi:primosomal protein N' (replication factor Y)
VAGRAGRGAVAGEVIVQTFLPHHYAIDMAARLAEEEFYERELHVRQMLRFPPFARLAAILVAGPDLEAVRDHAERLSNFMKKRVYLPDFKTVQVLGPTPAPIARIEDQHRWRILGRCPRVRPLHDLLRDALAEYSKLPGRGKVNVTIDIDPVDLM